MIRLFDIIFSGLSIIILSPFFLFIILILRFTGEKEIFFIQPRVGKGKKIFGLIKFATMLKNSPDLPGGDITVSGDPRVLPFGHFLRKTKINELPQLFNVLKGNISIVGPRPLTPRTFEFYSKDVQSEFNSMSPGLTGIGSIVFRDEEKMINSSSKSPEVFYQEEIAPYKGELEKWYARNTSIHIYFLIVIITAWVIFFPKSDLLFKFFPSLPKKPESIIFF